MDDLEEEMRLAREASRQARLATYVAGVFAAAAIVLWLVASVLDTQR